MNDGVIGIVFSLVYVSLKEFGVVGSDMYTWGIKDFHKCWSGSLANRRLPWAPRCNKLHSTICIVLLSEFVSWNAWLQHDSWVVCAPSTPQITLLLIYKKEHNHKSSRLILVHIR